ncbi:MAG: hypothetical protein ABF629_15275, partial [Sporolactobacillus sp.]
RALPSHGRGQGFDPPMLHFLESRCMIFVQRLLLYPETVEYMLTVHSRLIKPVINDALLDGGISFSLLTFNPLRPFFHQIL